MAIPVTQVTEVTFRATYLLYNNISLAFKVIEWSLESLGSLSPALWSLDFPKPLAVGLGTSEPIRPIPVEPSHISFEGGVPSQQFIHSGFVGGVIEQLGFEVFECAPTRFFIPLEPHPNLDDNSRDMKSILVSIVAAVVLVGCGESQQSAPTPEATPVELIAEAAKPEPPTAKAPDIDIYGAAYTGNIEAIKQHLAAGADVNNKGLFGGTPLIYAESREIIELLIVAGADVNYSPENGITPLAHAVIRADKESAELLITSGADVNSKDRQGHTPLDTAKSSLDLLKIDEEIGLDMDDIAASKAALKEITDLLRKHGGKTGEELKAEGK